MIEVTVSSDPDAVADLLLRVPELMAGRELDPSAREHAREMATRAWPGTACAAAT